MDDELKNIKREWEESDKFIQDLVTDFTWIEWAEGTMEISSVPKGWEKIVRDLFECINKYSRNEIYRLKTDWKSRIWNTYCKWADSFFMKLEKMFDPYKHVWKRQVSMIFPEDREKASKTLKFKIQRKIQNFRWGHFKVRTEKTYPPTLIIEQIKQKFDLRIYVSGGDDRIKGMIRMAEHLASKTCEETGRAGVLCVKNGWYRTLSKAKAKQYGYTILKN